VSPSELLASRARGCMLGLAAGNLLGVPNESRARPANPPLTDIDPAELSRPWDDDLAQAFELAESLAEHGEVEARDLGARFLEWARANGRGMGHHTRNVVRLLEEGLLPLAASRVAWERAARNAAGNGGVMRVAPVGLAFHAEPERCREQARLATALTHWDPRCTQSAAAVACAIAALLRGEPPLPAARAAVEASEETDEAPEPELLAVLEALPDLALDDLPLRAPHPIGYTLTCAAVGLWAVLQPGSCEEVLLAVTNAGGDADTNGAVAGALLGARHGLAGLPERWRTRIPGRERLERVALRLVSR
jgi:ADP-ribosylglycohydrolase